MSVDSNGAPARFLFTRPLQQTEQSGAQTRPTDTTARALHRPFSTQQPPKQDRTPPQVHGNWPHSGKPPHPPPSLASLIASWCNVSGVGGFDRFAAINRSSSNPKRRWELSWTNRSRTKRLALEAHGLFSMDSPRCKDGDVTWRFVSPAQFFPVFSLLSSNTVVWLPWSCSLWTTAWSGPKELLLTPCGCCRTPILSCPTLTWIQVYSACSTDMVVCPSLVMCACTFLFFFHAQPSCVVFSLLVNDKPDLATSQNVQT